MREGRVPARRLTVLQCLLCWEAGEGQVGTKACEGALLWPKEEVQTAKKPQLQFEIVPTDFLILYSQPGSGEL